MNRDDCLDMITGGYRALFDVYAPYALCGRELAAYCFFTSRAERYVLAKKAVLWSADTFEHVAVADVARLTGGGVREASAYLVELERALVRPGREHMCSLITLLLLCGGVDGEAVRLLRKTRFERDYLFTWHGYSSGRIVAICPQDGAVYSNAAGKPVAAFYRKRLAR